ncbi:acyltransferase family protein [Noviherbaspirillum saxi]|uniref:Acyltransferase n=1 Tax=Noviherbaspirillum saxi TaxID=2320863 RepID=A0A3A3FSM2_9BURK|nr:acyltransferase [Noviherbaspirillum saxi]RJF98773.1 acyltransferase [Noviherbaspirillum saxi]
MDNTGSVRLNNFDFLRIVAAFLVLISHQYALNGLPEPAFLNSMSLGTLGVLVFFSISGFLVSQSWRQDPHAIRFLAKRILRIWPGLAAVTLISACVLGPMVSTLQWQDYLHHPNLTDFLRNLKVVTIRYFLPGVFEENVYPRAVNGSLWTIPLEVRCYLALLVVGCIGLMKHPLLVLLGLIGFTTYYFAVAPDPLNYQYHFGLFFFAGVCLDLFRNRWMQRPAYLFLALGVLAAGCYLLGAGGAAFFLLIPVVVVAFGIRSTAVVKRAGRFGDMSYGIYIYAFPVQQTILWIVGKDFPFMQGLLLAAIATTVCAYLSWHLIERPALGLKRRLPRRAAGKPVTTVESSDARPVT